MSVQSREREALARLKPVKFFVVGMTPGPDGKAAVSFLSDMTMQEIKAVHQATAKYLEQKVAAEFNRTPAPALLRPDSSVLTEKSEILVDSESRKE
jgi:hypothetical protein